MRVSSKKSAVSRPTAHCSLPSAYFSIRDSNRNPRVSLRASDVTASNGRAVPVVVENPRLSENDQPRGPTTRGRGTLGERAPGRLLRLRSRPPLARAACSQTIRSPSARPRCSCGAGTPGRLGRPGVPEGRGSGKRYRDSVRGSAGGNGSGTLDHSRWENLVQKRVTGLSGQPVLQSLPPGATPRRWSFVCGPGVGGHIVGPPPG